MNPQDDPEARIRALEPTELGAEQASPSTYDTPAAPPLPPPTQQWPQPPYGQSPPGPDPYGLNSHGQNPYGADPYGGAYAQPYPSAPQRSGLRAWMVIVPLALVLLFFGGAAAAFWLFSADDSTPEVAGGGGVLTDEPAQPVVPRLPEIPELPPIVVDPGGPNTPVESGGTITITGIGTNRTVACDDHIVIISGANNTIDVTGHCTAVTVSGFENVVTAQSTDEITVSGFENRVTYRDGSPTVNQSGSGNTIEQG